MAANMDDLIKNLSTRLEIVENKLGLDSTQSALSERLAAVAAIGGGGKPPTVSSAGAEVLDKFNELLETKVKPFIATSKEIGLNQVADKVKESFDQLHDFLTKALQSRKPSAEELQEMMQPLSNAIKDAGNLIRDVEASMVNHAKAVVEGISSIGWVNPAINTPASFVSSFAEASVFYANKVRTEFKRQAGGDLHVKWANQLNEMWQGLADFVKQYQTTGVTWNQSAPASAPKPTSNTSSGPASTGGPPKLDASMLSTSGLKKVTNDMKTKNRKDKTSTVPVVASKPKTTKTWGAANRTKNPKFLLEQNKWMIEDQTDNVLTIEEGDIGIKNTVYIYGCENNTVIIKGKCNNITLDSCRNTQVLFESVLAVCEIVNSKSVKVQSNKSVPTVTIDKSDGVMIYVMDRQVAKGLKLVTSKSSEMNLSYPAENADDGFIEIPIPEQFVHIVTANDTIDSDVSELYKAG